MPPGTLSCFCGRCACTQQELDSEFGRGGLNMLHFLLVSQDGRRGSFEFSRQQLSSHELMRLASVSLESVSLACSMSDLLIQIALPTAHTTHTHTHTHAHTHAHTHTHTHTQTHTHTHTHTHSQNTHTQHTNTHTHTCMYVSSHENIHYACQVKEEDLLDYKQLWQVCTTTHTNTYKPTHKHAYLYKYLHEYIDTYIPAYLHIYIHIYT